MALKEIYEKDSWKLKATVVNGDGEGEAVTFTIFEDEKSVATGPGKIQGGSFTHAYEAAPVAPDKPNYGLTADAEYDNAEGHQKKQVADECRVWPRTFMVIAKGPDKKACPDFEFTAKQGSKALDAPKTDQQGKSQFSLERKDGDVDIEAKSPWILVSRRAVKGKLRELDLEVRRSFIPEFVKPVTKDKLSPPRQYVNLKTADNGCDFKGPEVELEVRVKEDNTGYKGKAGDVIYIQATFSQKGKHLSRPELRAADAINKTNDKIQTGQVKLTADDGTAKFKVFLGLYGGNTCEIRLSCRSDDFSAPEVPVLKFENWREVAYEILRRKYTAPNEITNQTQGLDAGLHTDVTDLTKASFDKVHVDLKRVDITVYDKTDLTPGAFSSCIWPQSWFKTGATGDAYIAAIDAEDPDPFLIKCDLLDIIDKKGKAVHFKAGENTFAMICPDYLIVLRKWHDTYHIKKDKQVTGPNAWMLPKNPRAFNGIAQGDFSIKSVAWSAYKYHNGTSWVSISKSTDPGFAHTTPTTFTNTTDIKKMINIKNSNKLEVTLATDPGFPGDPAFPGAPLKIIGTQLCGEETLTGTWMPVKINLEIKGVYCFILGGCALSGKVLLPTHDHKGKITHPKHAAVMLHEMGHNLGMTYLGDNTMTNRAWGKWERIDTRDIKDYPPPLSVDQQATTGAKNRGDYYVEKGHRGCHCAFGLSDIQKAKPKYDGPCGTASKCIMYGSTTSATDYCTGCQEHLRHEDLSDVHSDWIKRK